MNGITLESVQTMKNSLVKFNMTQEEMIRALKSEYESLSSGWNDPKFVELGNALDSVYSIMNNSYVEVSKLVTNLQMIEGYLIDITGVKLGS
ncbi:MAG: hypothetical protein J6C99_10200 [Lachnospiraceae bacterium]|nr:hypothetical protein [Lachnospiraceae bacterium]